MATAFERTMNSKMVCRPGFGKEGRDINLFANFYRMKFNPRITVYHYDIDIEPNCPKFLRRRLVHAFAQKNKQNVFAGGLPVYDGNKNVYSSIKLPVGNDPLAVEVELPEHPDSKARKFTIKIKFAAQIDMSCLEQVLKGSGYGDVPQETLVVADIVLRHFPSMRYTVAGRSMYTKPDQKHSLGDATELWSGLYTSARASNWGLVLNVDESHTAFYEEQPVLNFMTKHLRINGEDYISSLTMRDSDLVTLEKQLRGLRVTVNHQAQKRQYRIEKLTRKTTSQISFDVNGTKTSMAQYFRSQYNYQLKYLNLPCVWVSPKEKNTFIPLEVCTIVAGQRCLRKLTDNETRTMIRATAKKPHIRKAGTEEKMKKMQLNKDPFVSQFGFTVDQSMVQVKGKVLPPPKLMYSNKKPVTPQGGVWDNKGNAFYKACNIKNWAVLIFPPQNRCESNDVKAFCMELIKHGQQLGMSISQPGYVKYLAEQEIPDVCQEIIRRAAGGPIDLVYCVLPQGSSTCYAKIKHVFENQHSISTQCMELKNLKPPKAQTIGNILQKINAKIGGTNNTSPDMTALGLFNKPAIIMGADLSHPAQGEGNKLSVCSVVGSMDRFACRYSTQISLQEPPPESNKTHSPVIEGLQAMVKALLIEFYQNVKTKPARIVFYRGGASEGQFYHIMMYEVDAIRKACMELPGDAGKPYQPDITFIVTQKTHHTRLFVQNPKDGDRSGNVPAGTVVDQGITSAQDFDFYLNSHQGIQGTNKPAKYHVLTCDYKYPADMIYKLTYYLCHVYARCTRSVSYPAPAYYAHLVTDRARAHLASGKYNVSDGASSTGAQARHILADILADISPHQLTKKKMYWV